MSYTIKPTGFGAEYRVARLSKIQRVILDIVGGVGMLSIALLAPNAVQALRFLNRKKLKVPQARPIARAKQNLVSKGFIVIVSTPTGKVLRLSKKGERMFQSIRLQSPTQDTKRNWDKKWRIIIFDISEKRRRTRNQLRQNLIVAGFYKVQQSVWVHPYPCEELVGLLKADLQIGKEVLYMVVEHLEGDQGIRTYFNLPPAN